MKHLLLLRHGEAETSSATQDDRDRILTAGGLKASEKIGAHIGSRGPVPDLAMCSAAVRARATWDAARRGISQEIQTDTRDDLYLAEPDRVLSVAATAPPSCGTLIVIGHNPGFAQLVRLLTVEATPDALSAVSVGFPTTGLAVFDLDIETWRDLPSARGALASFVRR